MKEAVGKGWIPALVDADEHKGRLELEAARDVLTDPVLFKLFQLHLNRAREMYSVGQEPWCIRENETPLDHLARRQKAPGCDADIRRRVMRCGCNRGTTPREEASAHRWSYWAALGGNYPPIGGG
jgi:hypothetical protein